jgi:hypothetical protein
VATLALPDDAGAQHRASAAQLRAQGNFNLAQQHENLAKGIEKRLAGKEPLAAPQ